MVLLSERRQARTLPIAAAAQPVLDVAAAGRRYSFVRIGFGLIWAIDATLKWLPGFRNGFGDMISDAGQGQPGWLAPWFRFWSSAVGHDPALFAIFTALAETAICFSLLFGVLQRVGFVFGAIFSTLIWAVGEGFGGPYMSGATDIGCAVIYTVVFIALWAAVPRVIRQAAPALDHRLAAPSALRWATFH